MINCLDFRSYTAKVDSSECVLMKVDFDLLIDPMMENEGIGNNLQNMTKKKIYYRESLQDDKCATLNELKSSLYNVDFDHDLQKKIYSTISPTTALNFTESLKSKGIIQKEYLLSKFSKKSEKIGNRNNEKGFDVFDYNSLMNVYDRVLMLKRLLDKQKAHRMMTKDTKSDFMSDSEILTNFQKFYNLKQNQENRKQLIKGILAHKGVDIEKSLGMDKKLQTRMNYAGKVPNKIFELKKKLFSANYAIFVKIFIEPNYLKSYCILFILNSNENFIFNTVKKILA